MITVQLPRNDDGTLLAYAWPGGYPIVYYFADGEACCPACANGANGSLAGTSRDKSDDWRIVGYDIHYEGPPERCAHCYQSMPSAYGDPNEDTDI